MDAVTVLSRRKGVCAGFANLFQDMARSAGLTVETLHGAAGPRKSGTELPADFDTTSCVPPEEHDEDKDGTG